MLFQGCKLERTMAELNLRRALLRSPAIAAATRVCVSFFRENNAHYATSTAASSSSKEAQESVKEKGKWFTLPPFNSTIDAASVAKEFSGHRSDRKSEITSTTALKWVLRCCPQIPRSLVQKLFRLRQVRRESANCISISTPGIQALDYRPKRVAAKDSMNSGDRIFLPITVQEMPSQKHECRCNEDEINYIHSLKLYKDPAIIIVNKPPGMPVQGGIGIKNSLDELAATYLRYDYSEPPLLVHRLDRDSSGILVMGRTQTSATILHSIFREKTYVASKDDIDNNKKILQRRYVALVIGTPRQSKGLVSAPLGKVMLDNGKYERITVVNDVQAMSSQHAITEYQVIESGPHGYTWLELRPLTGRKHQLRVHCAEVLGTPIVGDYKYGWQAHRNWNPVPWSNCERNVSKKQLPRWNKFPFGLDLDGGSISEKKPGLHLHCKQMVLPNISLALQHIQSSLGCELPKVENLNLVAPLPSHMQRSWDILSS